MSDDGQMNANNDPNTNKGLPLETQDSVAEIPIDNNQGQNVEVPGETREPVDGSPIIEISDEDMETKTGLDLSNTDESNETKRTEKDFTDEVNEEEDPNKHKREKLEKTILPTDFYYDYEELISRPYVTEESGLPIDLVRFTHSSGFDCAKRDNLVLMCPEELCFVAGNFVQFLSLEDGSNRMLRSVSGHGIGCIAVHPSQKYLAVGEKSTSESPMIVVYEYPSLRPYRLLRLGTERAYSYCQFNPTGELLASVGSDPDYMLTVWEWENEQIVLRSKAFSQDVHRVSWSSDLEGILATSGTGHIKFWKMADTFTGLKLQGHIGKFGKTEISDVEGYVILPDGKVLSGSEWGNLLVWDGDLIKVQIGRKNKKTCHGGEISQVIIEEGELMTVGTDGWINTWDFETIDTAEVAEEMAVFEMEPMNEMSVATDAKLMHIVKSTDPESSIWYAQDASGKIWKLDLSFSHTSAPPQVVASYHSGKIVDCDVSPISYISASLGVDGTVRVFDFAANTLMAENRFPSGGTKVLWAPLTIDPKGKTVIGGFEDGVVRILFFTEALDTDISRKSKFKGELTLIQALKPHTKRITSLCTDDKGEILITGSEDETVFFFSVTSVSEYVPVGFVRLHQPVRRVEWLRHDKEGPGYVLVYTDSAEVMTVLCPEPPAVDHSHTYEIRELQPLPTTENGGPYQFVSIKSHLRHLEELEAKKLEELERQKELDKIRKDRLERGLDTEEDQQKQIEEDERRRTEEAAKEDEWTPHIPEEPSSILFGFVDPTAKDKFWLSMSGYDAGYLYQCEFASSEKRTKHHMVADKYNIAVSSMPMKQTNDVPVTVMVWSQSGLRLFMGLQNGAVRVQTVTTPFDLRTMQSCWQFSMHDNDYGAITALCISHDEKFVISVGNDGNYFVYEVMGEDMQKAQVDDYRARLPSASIPVVKETIDDIDDPNAYSIEEHKQKSEYDRKVKLAQEKKQATLRKITDLQKQFRVFKEHNEKLPERIKLTDRAFELVPELRVDMQKIKEDKIQLVHKQMAFESEKCRLALEKLEKRFRQPLESDFMEVHAIQSEHTVSTVRGCKLSKEYFCIFEELERIRLELMQKDNLKDASIGNMDAGLNATSKMDETDEFGKLDEGLSKFNLRGARGMRVARQLKKLEENRKKRTFRKAQWDALFAEKPKENYEDPRDIDAINKAKVQMGDFKLKSSEDYFVPEEDRPNAYKARSELIAIENRIFQMRSAFNNKVKGLVSTKKNIIKQVRDTNIQIDIFNKSTPGPKRKLLPDVILYPSENPEKKFEYTKASLIEFKKEMEERKKAALQGDDAGKQGFGTFSKSVTESTLTTAAAVGGSKASGPRIVRPGGSVVPSTMGVIDEVSVADSTASLMLANESQLQREAVAMNHARDRCHMEAQLEATLRALRIFDTHVRLLRHERCRLDLELRRASLRQLTVFEEYRLLKAYEKSELSLSQKAADKTAEKNEYTQKLQDYLVKLESKKKDIEKLMERDRMNFDKFKDSLGENNKFADYLTKVYKKKIKRRKEAVEDDDDSDESSDSDDSEMYDSEEESQEDTIVYDLEMCPPGCSQDLYDSTCQLREFHLDIEEELTEERRQLEALRKEQDTVSKKLKVVEAGLLQAKKELEAFQLEKQQKLNQLRTCVLLCLQQIIFTDGQGGLPSNLDAGLVFEISKYRGLRARIHHLKHEEIQQEQNEKHVKQRHMKLQQNKKLFQRKIVETQVECDEMMKTKFGKLDNLEKMEQVMVNPKVEELTFKMLELQEDMYCEQSQWEDQIREAQELCIGETKVNTCILNSMLNLYNDKETYEDKLDSKQKDLGTEFQLTGPAAEEEISRLTQLVEIQTQELEALKEEIGMLSRKGGHLLPPVGGANPCDREDSSGAIIPTEPAWETSQSDGADL